MAPGNDFDELKRLAKQQDAERQAKIAKEEAAREREAAARQAARDAKEKAERERSRQLLKTKEEEQKRKAEEQKKLAAQKEEWNRQRQEQLKKAAELAKVSQTNVVTKKMIKQREKVLGPSKGRDTKSSSAASYLPLTRQEKRERREREALGLDLRRSKASAPSPTVARVAASPLAGPSSRISSTSLPSVPKKAGAQPPRAVDTAEIQALERQLKQAVRTHEVAKTLPTSKENSLKLRDAETQERDLRRKLAMARKREEERQLARIRAGLPPIEPTPESTSQGKKRAIGASDPGSTESNAKKAKGSDLGRPETARERFVREQAEKAAEKAARKSVDKARPRAKTKSSLEYRESDDDSDEDMSADAYSDEEDEDDGFIDDGEDEGQYDIWSIMNPGKDRSKYLARPVDDSDDDMEADADSVRREELRSERQAREEDRREEELLRKKEREKALRKAAANKARS